MAETDIHSLYSRHWIDTGAGSGANDAMADSETEIGCSGTGGSSDFGRKETRRRRLMKGN